MMVLHRQIEAFWDRELFHAVTRQHRLPINRCKRVYLLRTAGYSRFSRHHWWRLYEVAASIGRYTRRPSEDAI
jgi:hypothetical protein